MKILHLSGPMPQPWGIDLHPRLTVVHGLDPAVAGAVAAAVDAVVRGRAASAPGLTGRVEVDGRPLDLDDALAGGPGLVPAPPLTAADLVDEGLSAGRARALDAEVAHADAGLVEAERALEALRLEERTAASAGAASRWRQRATAAAALRRARLRVADAVTTDALAAASRHPSTVAGAPDPEVVRLAAERIDSARRALDAAVAARDEAEAERARLDAASGARGDALRAELADVEHRCIAMAPAAPPTETDRRALAQRRSFLADELAALTAQPSVQVSDALAAAEAHRGIDEFEAGRVAVEWERVHELVAEADAAPPPPPAPAAPLVSSVTMSEASAARLARAHDDVANARRTLAEASGASPLDPAEVEALEAAHAEVLAAWEGSERRIGVGRARRRLEDAQLAEREILARMGFASYTEFMVSGRASGTPSNLDAEEARRALVAAEQRLAALEAHVEQELTSARAAEAAAAAGAAPEAEPGAARGRLSATLAALRARAVDLLGEDPGDDVAEALRERISTDPLHDLRLALDEVGVPLGQVMSRDAVLARAREWIARAESQAARRSELVAAQAEVDGQIAALEAAEGARAAWEALVARRDALRAQVEATTVAAAIVEAAEERLVRDRADVDRAEAALEEARAEADLAITAATPPRAHLGTGDPPTTDLAALEAEARDAQTALDVAVAHLLPPRTLDEDPGEALARAEARVALARLERDTLLALRADRRAQGGDEALDAASVEWRLLSRLARQSQAAAEGGPGPTPLVLDEPFGSLQGAAVAAVCEALVGPAERVQVIVLTEREDVAAWARGLAAARGGLAVAGVTPQV